MRNSYKILKGEPEGNRPLGRHKRRCEDNIRMDLSEIRWGVVDWIHLAQDKDQWRCLNEHGNKRLDSIKGGEFIDWLSDYQLLKEDSTP
jgi:hypothetical protein